MRSDSRKNGRLTRLTRNPGTSAASMTCLPIASATARYRHRLGSARDAGDDLRQTHHRRGVEEVKADDSLGYRRPSGDLGHRERGGVRRKDAPWPADVRQAAE